MLVNKLTRPDARSNARKKGSELAARSNSRLKALTVFAFIAALVWMNLPTGVEHITASAATFPGFPYSTPITLNNNGNQLWVVSPDSDNNSVTVINITNDFGPVLAEIPVGVEPNSVAINGNDSRAYVANTVSGTVSVIDTNTFKVIETINVGVEPRALCFTPNFTRLYVACSSSNDIHVINPNTNRVIRVISNPSFSNLYAMTITNDGDADDNDEFLYATNLFAEYVPGKNPSPADDLGKVGVVNVISTATDTFIDRSFLKSVKTDFKSNGRARNASSDAVNPNPNPNVFDIDTFAFPNMLNSIAGFRKDGQNFIYTFATGSSPTGPVRFNVNVQSLVSLIKGLEDAEQTTNLNDQIRLETTEPFADGVPKHRFATMPWGIAFYHNSFKALGVASAVDYVAVLDFNDNGKATISPAGPGKINRILTGTKRDPNPDNSIFTDGKAPRGVVINKADTRAYTFNYVSRDITVLDLVNNRPITTIATTQSKGDSVIQYGKELFNTAMGPIDSSNKKADGSVNPIEGRMSDFGWVGCVSCHINGLTDGVAWHFGSGPRVSVSMNGSFSKAAHGPIIQRALNWSAIFDEVEDFEDNTRNVAGGAGLIQLANGAQDPVLNAFALPNRGRDDRRDAITEYVKTIRTPIAPESATDPAVIAGRKLFKKVGCAVCHNGPLWTKSIVEFPPPPPAAEVVDQQLTGQLVDVGTFNPANPHEVRGVAAVLNQPSRGALGFNIPSLLGVHTRERFLLHDGILTSFDELFNNKAHVGDNTKLKKKGNRDKLIKFLRSIDDKSTPF